MAKDSDSTDAKAKPGLFGRVFGRGRTVEPEPQEPEPQQPAPPPAAAPEGAGPKGWWSRLRQGLARSSDSIGSGLAAIFTKRKLDGAMLDDLEDVLIRADLGVATASRISGIVGKGRYDKTIEVEDVKEILAAEIERVLIPCARPLEIDAAAKPNVILVVGVNGSGKTTTIGKLAAQFTSEGRRVVLAAGDTFRAAAIEQLRIWGARLGCEVIARAQGSDASALAYDAMQAARESGADVLLMDTAGRLQNRAELMAELEKIIRTMKKLDPAAPHAVLLVLDATVGQNAAQPGRDFRQGRGRHRPRHDQARRHRARRHPRRHRREIRFADPLHRRWRNCERSRRLRRGGVCAGHRRAERRLPPRGNAQASARASASASSAHDKARQLMPREGELPTGIGAGVAFCEFSRLA